MKFEEVLEELSNQTKEIEVCASGAYDMDGKICIGIRSGSAPADMEFHDPIIDDMVFMICGDIFTANYGLVKSIRVFKDYNPADKLFVRLRAVSNYIGGINITADLGIYDIEKVERLTLGDFAVECHVKLALKRRGS